MDPAIIDQIVQYVQGERQVADYAIVAAIALLLYDYVLTIHDEITLIWFTKWSHIKILFFLVRYMPFASLYATMTTQLLLNVPTATCLRTSHSLSWLVTFGVIFPEAALMVRTWAVWHHNRYVGGGLAMLWAITVAIGCYVCTDYVRSQVISPKPYEGFRGCFITAANMIPRICYILLAFVETVVMVLMVISAYKSYKFGRMSELSHVIHRDGILFYFYLLVVAILNVLVMFLLPGKYEQVMVTPLQMTIYSILTSRILINIRNAAYIKPTSNVIENSTMVFEMHPITISADVEVTPTQSGFQPGNRDEHV